MKTFTANLEQAKRDYNALIERRTALTTERQDGITQYEEAYERIQTGDEEAVEEERQRLRADSERRISETVSKIYGDRYDAQLLDDATKKSDFDIMMDRRAAEHRQSLREHYRRPYKSDYLEDR